MTVIGTRPETIRLSQVILRLDAVTDHTVVHTGQNWDPLLSDVFFEEFGLRTPDRFLEVDTSSLGHTLGDVLANVEPLLHEVKPDAFLVLGDTNSCLAAVMAKRVGIPVFHMEAGNRCFDENVPEETNRRIIDHVADFNLCYTEHARRNLLGEGLQARRVFVTGSPLFEVLHANRARIEASTVLERFRLEPHRYLLASINREENIDNPENLARVISALARIRDSLSLRLLVTTHPRLRDRLDRFAPDISAAIEFYEPFGYFDYVKLQQYSRCVVSDSGTISEESAMLGFPAVTIRNAMERPEALDSGCIVLTGLDPSVVESTVRLVVAEGNAGFRPSIPPEYQVPDCSHRVVRLIMGLAGLHRRWANLDPVLRFVH
jgi:UDP-N-acetyl-L-fucosamine synthase